MAYVKNASTQVYITPAADTTHVLSEQIVGKNEIDDILILNIGIDVGGNVNAVTGWTELRDSGTLQATGHAILWRRATAVDEALPDIVTTSSGIVAAQYIVVYGCPTGSTPIGNTSNANGTATPITWSTINYSANSTVLFLASIDGTSRTISSPSTGIILPTASGTANAVAIKKFYTSSGSTGSVTAVISATDGWIASAVELLDNGNGEVPMQFSNVPAEKFSETALSTTNGWRDALTNAQVNPATGASIANTKTFDASTNVDTTLDTITITGHGLKTGTVMKADANGNTLPTGITDGAYYFVHVVDANTIKLMTQNANITVTTVNVAGGWYDDDTTPATIDITATGSGTCRLINSTIIRVGYGSYPTAPRANAAVACFHNIQGMGTTFTSPRDMTAERFQTNMVTPSGALNGDWYLTFIDNDGDYKTWKVATLGKLLAATTDVQVSVMNQLYIYEYGTFDSTIVKHIVFWAKGNADDSRFGAGVQWYIQTSEIIRTAEVVGGTGTLDVTWDDVYYELRLYTTNTSSRPSDSMIILSQSIQLGDGTNDLVFTDGAKSLYFSSPSDGVTSLVRYILKGGVLFDLTAGSTVTLASELFSGDSYNFKVDPAISSSSVITISSTVLSGADISLHTGSSLTGVSISKGDTVVLDSTDMTGCTIENTVSTNATVSLTSNQTISTTEIDEVMLIII
jgi:hypothetical protein